MSSIEARLLIYGLTTGPDYPANGDYSIKYHIGASIEHITNFIYVSGNLIDIQSSNWSANYVIFISDTDQSITQLNENTSVSLLSENAGVFNADWIFENHFYLPIIISSYSISTKQRMHSIFRNTKTSED